MNTETVCYGDLGCFSRTGHFGDPRHRPISVVPQSPEIINTNFLLYTRQNPYEPQILNKSVASIVHSNLNIHRPTKILVAGFLFSNVMGKYQQKSFQLLIRSYLNAGDYNVILCDWGEGASTWYFQASANSRVVGAEIANLVKFMAKVTGLRMQDVHVVGHSLGAHIAGYAGERIHNLGRITALDPAKPYFEATHPSVRLDPSDALYVDVVHSDASVKNGALFSLGTRQLMGDVDFFPNNGDIQPGCDVQPVTSLLEGSGIVGTIRDTVTCDHRRSVELLSDYLAKRQTKGCFPLAYKCTSWQEYQQGQCYTCGLKGENCAVVGEPKVVLDKWTQKYPFYLKTSRESPLCAFQYRVQFTLLSNHPDSSLEITIYGEREGEQVTQVTTRQDWQANTVYALVIAGQSRIRFINGLSLTHGMSRVEVESASVMPMNEWSDRVKRRLTLTVCRFTEHSTRTRNPC